MKAPIEYIKKINVNSANFRHIADSGRINGTLLTELIKLISEVREEAESNKEQEGEGEWISVEIEPDLGPGKMEGNIYTTLYSKEFICFDGDTVFIDSYNIDEGFNKSITHYRHFPTPPKK